MLQYMKHTAGIYSFFAKLALAERQKTGAMCEHCYLVGKQKYNRRQNTLAEFRVGQQRTRFGLEWDRGTMNARNLAVKFTS